MTDQFDRFARSASRTLDALGWTNTVRLYQPTESYAAGDGFSVAYPETPTTVLDAALDTPSATGDIDPGGTTETIDLTAYVAEFQLPDLVVSGSQTIAAGETAQHETVLIESGATLTVEGRLEAEAVVVIGTLDGDGDVVVTDFGINYISAGESGEARTGLEIDGRKYVVDEAETQFDGFLALQCREVDEWR